MQFTIKGSHILAVALTAGIAYWMLDGEVEIGGQSEPTAAPVAAVDAGQAEEAAEAPTDNTLFKVSVVTIDTIERKQSVPVRGRTKADAVIPIRAETGGILENRKFSRGDRVKEGDLVCVIDQGARNADLASAQARFEQMQADYDANLKLEDKGFVTATVMRQKKFELDAAKAQLEQAEIELKRTEVRANAAGVVQDPIAEVGDVLSRGDTCLTLVDSDPMFFTGQISERAINAVQVGMNADVRLVTGETVTGNVSYIGQSADPQTRTFPIEIRLESQNGNAIRDGLTATAGINLPAQDAIRISPSWVSLADNGAVGVKIVDDADIVVFKPIQILSQTNEGFWISGLESGYRVITLGHEYVIAGEKVEPVPAEFRQAKVSQ